MFISRVIPQSLRNFFSGHPVGRVVVVDASYDSPAEKAAADELENFNVTTVAGRAATFERSNGSCVRVVRDGGTPYILGWINPAHHDPVVVKMTVDGKFQCRWAKDIEDNTQVWLDDLTLRTYAQDVADILAKHRVSLLTTPASEPAIIPHI